MCFMIQKMNIFKIFIFEKKSKKSRHIGKRKISQ